MGQIADQRKKRFRAEIVAKLGPDVRTDWLGAESDLGEARRVRPTNIRDPLGAAPVPDALVDLDLRQLHAVKPRRSQQRALDLHITPARGDREPLHRI
jgi:hypothetical protein